MNSRANHKTKRPPRRGEQTLRPRPRNVANPIPIASHVVAFATDLPDWQITSDFQKSCQAPKSKIFPFAFYPNQFTDSRRPAHRGACARHERGAGCGGRGSVRRAIASRTNDAEAYGQVVSF